MNQQLPTWRKNPATADAAPRFALVVVLSFVTCGMSLAALPTAAQDMGRMQMQGAMENRDPSAWRMPPMDMAMAMAAFLQGRTPDVAPFIPGRELDEEQRSSLPRATEQQVIELRDGDSLDLNAGLVLRDLGDRRIIMYAFNGQTPGPLLKVKQHATITVNFTNNIEFPTTLRWHGVRLENEFDGVPGLTQRPVRPGNSFTYRVQFPDAGVFWYHPHQHADIAQDLGLFGGILVEPAQEDYYNPVNREVSLLLDDILIDDLGLFPWGFEAPTHALMGRFGNMLLVNGKPNYHLSVDRGEVVRFYLTNVANTRTFNLSWGQPRMKLIAADLGKFERETWVSSVVIAPGQRYTVEVQFEEPGQYVLTNRIQAINHFKGTFYPQTDTLATLEVANENAAVDYSGQFVQLREHEAVKADIDRVRQHFDRPVDHELILTMRAPTLPTPILQLITMDTLYFPPIEWNETMPMMNWLATGMEVTWILRDAADATANREFGPAIGWRFTVGDVVKIRLFNNPKSLHPMNHPMHLHGQRFLLLEQDGIRSTNLVWRDTILVPVGTTVDLLVEMSNPGVWMLNCQIPEHMGAGMAITLRVDPA